MKTRGEILANLSPELRSPINSILAHADILDAEIYGPLTEQQHHSMRSIIDNSQQVLGLLDDFFFYSQIEGGEYIPHSALVWVGDFCQNSLRLARESAYRRSINLITDFDNQVEGMVTDERVLKRVLVKLLNQAINGTPEWGNVTLIVKGNKSEETVQFSIENHWSIPSPESSTHPHEPFPSIEDENDLEMTLVRQLVDLQNGTIQVEERSASSGKVTVTLPWILPQKKSRSV